MPHVSRSTASLLVCAAILLSATGCHSKSDPTPENYIAGLNAHFLEHPECLFRDISSFPYETTDPVRTKQMNTLVTMQLLNVSVEHDVSASRYTTTPVGARLAPRFCYGHRVATSIDSSTPLAVVNGFKQTTVTYHYTLEDVPVWAKSAEVRAAFPQIDSATSGNSTDTSNLAQIPQGWQVPD